MPCYPSPPLNVMTVLNTQILASSDHWKAPSRPAEPIFDFDNFNAGQHKLAVNDWVIQGIIMLDKGQLNSIVQMGLDNIVLNQGQHQPDIKVQKAINLDMDILRKTLASSCFTNTSTSIKGTCRTHLTST